MVILDEFTYLCSYGIVDAGDALDVIRRSREISDVVVTGRNAPASLMDAADMVTEMRNIRHPLQRGIPSREGIEY
jgi:cob(I)alamin adenosyltransferase